MDGLMDGGDRRMEGPLNGVGKRGKGEGHRKGGKGGGWGAEKRRMSTIAETLEEVAVQIA